MRTGTPRKVRIGGWLAGKPTEAEILAAELAEVGHLQAQAQANLDEAGIENVTLVLGDGLKGYEAGEPYDAIVLTGSVSAIPEVLLHQLALGGRLMAVVGTGSIMEVVRIHCTGPGTYSRETLFETAVPPLENAPRSNAFSPFSN